MWGPVEIRRQVQYHAVASRMESNESIHLHNTTGPVVNRPPVTLIGLLRIRRTDPLATLMLEIFEERLRRMRRARARELARIRRNRLRAEQRRRARARRAAARLVREASVSTLSPNSLRSFPGDVLPVVQQRDRFEPNGIQPQGAMAGGGDTPDYLSPVSDLPAVPHPDDWLQHQESSVRASQWMPRAAVLTRTIIELPNTIRHGSSFWTLAMANFMFGLLGRHETPVTHDLMLWATPGVDWWFDLTRDVATGVVNCLTMYSRYGPKWLRWPLIWFEVFALSHVHTYLQIGLECSLALVFPTWASATFALGAVTLLVAPMTEEHYKRVSDDHLTMFTSFESAQKALQGPAGSLAGLLVTDSHFHWVKQPIRRGVLLHTVNNLLAFIPGLCALAVPAIRETVFYNYPIMTMVACLVANNLLWFGGAMIRVHSFLPDLSTSSKVRLVMAYEAFDANGGHATLANCGAFGLSVVNQGGVNVGNVVQLITALTTQERGPSFRVAVEHVCNTFLTRVRQYRSEDKMDPQSLESFSKEGINRFGEFVSTVQNMTNNDLVKAISVMYSSLLLIPYIIGDNEKEAGEYLKKMNLIDDHMYRNYKANKLGFVATVLEQVHLGTVWLASTIWGSHGLECSDKLAKLLMEGALLHSKRERIRTSISPEEKGDWITFSEYQRRLSTALSQTQFLLSKKGLASTALTSLSKLNAQLLELQVYLDTTFNTAGKRERAIALVLTGPSSVGKSKVEDLICSSYLRFRGLMSDKDSLADPHINQYVAKKTSGDKYDSTVYNHTHIYVEEECNTELIDTGNSEKQHYLTRMLSIVDEQSTPVNKAGVDDKGKVTLKAALAIFVTNAPFKGIRERINKESVLPAIGRAYFIRISTDPAYRTDDRVDLEKVEKGIQSGVLKTHADITRYSIGQQKNLTTLGYKPVGKRHFDDEPEGMEWTDVMTTAEFTKWLGALYRKQRDTMKTSKAADEAFTAPRCFECGQIACTCQIPDLLGIMEPQGPSSATLLDEWMAWGEAAWLLWTTNFGLRLLELSFRNTLVARLIRSYTVRRCKAAMRARWCDAYKRYVEIRTERLMRKASKLKGEERLKAYAHLMHWNLTELEASDPELVSLNELLKLAAIAAGAAVAVMGFSRLFSTATIKEQGGTLSTPKDHGPITVEDLETKVGAGRPRAYKPLRAAPSSMSWVSAISPVRLPVTAETGHRREDLSMRVSMTHVWKLEISRGVSRVVEARGVLVAPDIIATNAHSFGESPEGHEFAIAVCRDGFMTEVTHSVIVYREGESVLRYGDTILINVPVVRKATLLPLLPEEALILAGNTPPQDGWMLVKREADDLVIEGSTRKSFSPPSLAWLGPIDCISYRRVSGNEFEYGECGQPVFLTLIRAGVPHNYLVALHCGSVSNDKSEDKMGFGSLISRKMVTKFQKILEARNMVLPLPETAIPIEAQCAPLTRYDNLSWTVGAHGVYHGTFDVPITKVPMTARDSAFKPYVKELFGVDPNIFCRPIGNRGEYVLETDTGPARVFVDPYASFTNKALVSPTAVADILVHPDVFDAAIRDYIEQLDEMIEYPKLSPLTVKEAIRGLKDYVRPMQLKTSAGPGLDGTKEKYVVAETTEVSKEVTDRMLRFSEFAEMGYAQPLLVKAVPKDEVREMKWQRDINGTKEIFAPKAARMFFVSQFSDLLHQKMFLGPLLAVIADNPEACEHIIGIDTCSPEWEALYNEFSEMWDRMFDGDVEGWDCGILPFLNAGERKVFVHIGEKVGYNEEAMQQVKARLAADENPKVLMQRSVVGVDNLGPSGMTGTTERNSLKMSIFHRIVYYTCYAEKYHQKGEAMRTTLSRAPRFRTQVRLKSYGDDSLDGVRKSCDWFDQLKFVRTGTRLGIKCTTGDKSAATVPFRSIYDVTMLKRRFRPDTELSLVMAPLPEKSLAKACSMFTESSISDRDRDIEALGSVLYELAQYGRTEFEEKQSRFKQIILELGWAQYVRPGFWKTFDQIITERYRPTPKGTALVTGDGVTISSVRPQSRRPVPGSIGRQVLFHSDTMDNSQTLQNSDVTVGQTATMTLTNAEELGYRAPSSAANAIGGGAGSSIDEFLRRPVKIATLDWDYNTTFDDTIQPWKLWISNTAVQAKLAHYNMIRGNLRVSFQVVGSPFMYGRAVVGWIPFDQYNDTWQGLMNGVNSAELRSVKCNYLSQCICGYLDASKVHTIEFTLPFFCPNSWLSTMALEEWERLGAFYISQLCPLLWGNSGTFSTTVNVNVFAWLEDVELSGSTFNSTFATLGVGTIMPQTKRHHGHAQPRPAPARHVVVSHPHTKKAHKHGHSSGGMAGKATPAISAKTSQSSPSQPPPSTNPGPANTTAPATATFAEQVVSKASELQESNIISRTADTVASVAASLESVPVIGAVAKATSFVASGISSVAKWFGFSRPPLLTDHQRCAISNYGDYALTTTFDPVYKLSLDPKQEVTIDPTIAGVGADDEMALASLYTREACLTTFKYEATAVVDQLLFRIAVSPDIGTRAYYIKSGGTNYTVVHQPMPCQLASLPFSYWHGTMTYRFEIVASSYHRGKIGIFYEPNMDQQTAGDADPEARFQLSQVAMVDISQETNVEVSVDWGQRYAYGRIEDAESATTYKYYPMQDTGALSFTSSLTMAQSETNGFLEVRALNVLAGAVDPPTPVYISVFVKAEKMEFQAPSTLGIEVPQLYPPPAATIGLIMPQGPMVLNETDHSGDDQLAIVYFGEANASMRTLLKRVTGYWSNQKTVTWTAGQYIYNSLDMGMYPVMRFSYKYGDTKNTAYVADGFTFADGGTSSAKDLYDILRRCFVGVRGSVTYKITDSLIDQTTTAMVRRAITTTGDKLDVTFASGSATFTGGYNSIATLVGCQRFDTRQNSCISFNVPHYAGYKFHFCQSPDYGDLANDATTPWPFESNSVALTVWHRAVNSGTSVGVGMLCERVTGEDFTFLYFVATPTWYFPDAVAP